MVIKSQCRFKSKFALLESPFILTGFPDGSDGEESACNPGSDPGSAPGAGRSPGGWNGNPLQYSSLQNSMGRGPGEL